MTETTKKEYYDKVYSMNRNTHSGRFYRDADGNPMHVFTVRRTQTDAVVAKVITDYHADRGGRQYERYFISR